MDKFKINELVIYIAKDLDNNIYKVEIGRIKKLCVDGAFVYYHSGDTESKTNYSDLYKLNNEYSIVLTNLGGVFNNGKK